MSKIRIYELAKELGVDNRVIIERATELGMDGKASHSNSLDASEADLIRRAIIRQAIGVTPASEVMTTRVDRTTGATTAVMERRSGNVIRRRRAEGSESGAALDVSAQHQEMSEPERIPEVPEEPTLDSIFKTPEPELEIEEEVEEVEVEAEQIEEAEPPVEVVEIERPEDVVPAPKPVVQRVEAAPATVAPTPPAAAGNGFSVEVKKVVGPRVLGKIELPQKKVIVRPAARPAAAEVTAPVISDEEEDTEEKRKASAKKKTRKREYGRLDLVDYEGRDSKRGRGGPRVSQRGDSGLDARREAMAEASKPKQSKRVVRMDDVITVGEFAKQMSLKVAEVIARLMQLGMMATINQVIDQDTATIVAEEFGFTLESTSFDEKEMLDEASSVNLENVRVRPPVVTVMGHVDHGKTSLLDAIRSASVAAKEHGGITQHIGAYKVNVDENRSVTFIDTPGHAAFTSMRARGAEVTDIVILVVAADDGVMPQTIEAINHARAAEVPIIVAVNKIDKHGSNPDKVKQQLVEHGLQPEDWGGDTMFFGVSALKREGIKELLEGVLLVAEVKELRADYERRAKGTIIEAKQDRGRGTVATVLVQEGTLKVGDMFVAGSEYGRVRSMIDASGESVKEAGPSTPIEITGLNGMPLAGDDFIVVESDSRAREVSSNRQQKKALREERSFGGPISLEEFAKRATNQQAAELNIILKADVQGSVEAVREAIDKLSTEKVKVRVLHAAVGGINESDVQLAIASKAIVVGFGVRGEPRALAEAEAAQIQTRFYRVIYELIDDVKLAMVGLLAPIKQEVPLARVEVRETFTVPKIGTIGGCYVSTGTVKRGAFIRLLRDSRVVHEGKMSSLRRFKDDVREVATGYECGIALEGYNDIKSGDVLEVFEFKEVAATL